MYLLDTNTCIDFALGRSAALFDRVDAAFARGLSISTITLAELRVGANTAGAENKDEERLDLLIRVLTVRPFDEAAAQDYGRLVRQVGVKRRNFDRLIAAHARSRGLIVVTRNGRDFSDVPGLVVENWSA